MGPIPDPSFWQNAAGAKTVANATISGNRAFMKLPPFGFLIASDYSTSRYNVEAEMPGKAPGERDFFEIACFSARFAGFSS